MRAVPRSVTGTPNHLWMISLDVVDGNHITGSIPSGVLSSPPR